jgi:hypothetical protein
MPDGVTVTKNAVVCTTREFDPHHPDPAVPSDSTERAGVCVSQFGCSTNIAGDVVNQSESNGKVTADVVVDTVQVNLQLNIVIWVIEGAPSKVMAHEVGHRMISEHFYANADDIATRLAHDMIGHHYTATGPNVNEASRTALNNAAQELVGKYMNQVRDNSQAVQVAYDRITVHGTNKIGEMDAMKQAILEVEKNMNRDE